MISPSDKKHFVLKWICHMAAVLLQLMQSPEELAMTTNDKEFKAISTDELHRACVLDEQGREIPITRDMIEQACKSLIGNFHIPSGNSIN